MSIDLRNPLNEGINYLKIWRERYSISEYPSKIILNIFYRQYAMDSIWNTEIFNSFKFYSGTESSILKAYQKIEKSYSKNAENYVLNNRLDNLIKEGVEIGGLDYNFFIPLLSKINNKENGALEELEFSYLYWLLANKAVMMWASFGRNGYGQLDSISKVTDVIIKLNDPLTYKNSLNIFGNLLVSKFMETNYTPLKPILMNTYEEDFLTGVQAYQNRNYENAIYFFEKSMTALKYANLSQEIKKDTYETGYLNLANAKKENSDFVGAIECFKKAFDSNPGRPEFEKGYAYFGKCCFELNTEQSLRTAIKYLDICTQYFPENEVAYMNKGIAYIGLNEPNNALQEFRSAQNLGNSDAQSFINDYC